MKYLFFTDGMKSIITSEITDFQEARKRYLKLQELFPSLNWDYSNAEWTVRYF